MSAPPKSESRIAAGIKAQACPPWSPEEDRVLSEMARAGKSREEIAAAVGRTVAAVSFRKRVLGVLPRYGARTFQQVMTRRCLRCRQPFEAPHKAIFVCNVCHESDDWKGAVPEHGVCA